MNPEKKKKMIDELRMLMAAEEVQAPGSLEYFVTVQQLRIATVNALPALLEEVEKGYWMVMVDEVVADWGCPQYRETDDGEAYYWCFPDHDLPVADNLSELFVAAAQLGARKPLDVPPAPASDHAREG